MEAIEWRTKLRQNWVVDAATGMPFYPPDKVRHKKGQVERTVGIVGKEGGARGQGGFFSCPPDMYNEQTRASGYTLTAETYKWVR